MINPILLEFGPLQIRWYGVLMASAFLLGYFIIVRLGKKDGLSQDQLDEYLLYMFVGILGGARLGEILFYNPGYYFSNPMQMLYIWKGGLASHGAILGAIFTNWLFCRKHKIAFYRMADLAVIPVALGAMFIRIGNFTNGEIVGRISSVSWAMEFPGYDGLRHPSQLYEAVKNLAIFGFLLQLRKYKLPQGILFWSFIGAFSLLRFGVEFFKEFQTLPPSAVLTMGQWLSIPLLILSGVMIWRLRRSK